MNHYITIDSSVSRTSKPTKLEINQIQRNFRSGLQINSVEELSYLVVNKKFTWCPAIFKNSRRKSIYWENQSIFAYDFDKNSDYQYHINLLNDLGITPNLIYTTFSDTSDYRKYRIVFFLNEIIYNEEERDFISKTLSNILNDCDINCIEKSRMFFGGKEILYLNETLNDKSKLIEILTPFKTEEQKINYSNITLVNSNIFDTDKQYKRIELVRSKLSSMFKGNRHNTLYSSLCSLKFAGISDSDIINIIEPYEPKEYKGKTRKDINNINPRVNDYFYKSDFDSTIENIKTNINKFQLEKESNTIKNDNIKICKTYLTEINDYIFNKIKSNKYTLINADTNLGKTYLFLSQTQYKVLILQPYIPLLKQSVKQAKKLNRNVCSVMEGSNPNFKCDLIISTYEGISKFNTAEGIEWLKNCIIVVDEAHNITTSADYNYRQQAMYNILKFQEYANKVVYLTATPIKNTLFEYFNQIIVQKEERRKKKLYLVTYKNWLQSLLNRIEKHKGRHIIHLDNKIKCERLYKTLTKLGYKCLVINSEKLHSDSLEDFVNNGTFPENIDILITTRILSEGFRIDGDIVCLHILSILSKQIIHQFSERPNNNAISNTYIYKNKNNMQNLEFNFNEEEYRQSLYSQSDIICKKLNKSRKLENKLLDLFEDIKNTHFKLSKKNKFKKPTKKKIVNENKIKTINKTIKDYTDSNLEPNLIIEKDGVFIPNKLGIEQLVYKKISEYEYRNPLLLLTELIKDYNFDMTEENIIIDDNDLESENEIIVKEVKEIDKTNLIKSFDNIVKNIEVKIQIHGDENPIPFKTQIQNKKDYDSIDSITYIKRYNELLEILDDSEQSLEYLKNIGPNNIKAYNNLIKSLNFKKLYNECKHIDIDDINIIKDIYSNFKINEEYTNIQLLEKIQNIYSKYPNLSEQFRIPEMTKSHATKFIKLFFHISNKTVRNNKDVFRNYKIESNDSFKNFLKL